MSRSDRLAGSELVFVTQLEALTKRKGCDPAKALARELKVSKGIVRCVTVSACFTYYLLTGAGRYAGNALKRPSNALI